MEQINLNTIPGIEMYPIIHVSQGDVGRQFKINLYNDEGEVVLDGTESLSITGYKADGNVFIYNLPSVTGSELTISTEEQMTAAKGECICEISVVKDTTKIGTANFIMQVEANPSAQGPLSTSALDVIDALLQLAHNDIETASSAATTATQKAGEAADSASSAATSASNAASSAAAAASIEIDVDEALVTATTAASNAATYASNAATSASNAATSASDAASSQLSAATSASSASTSATNAASSASEANSSALSASSSASSASTDASSASTSATNAANYASNAATSASDASNSATAAATSATNASTSESNASDSAASAAQSEQSASASASAANSSAVSAANSASTASTAATSASASETAAALSETNAATSATNAAASESAASIAASNASTSATAAASSATSAALSETNAADSESAASTAATNASASATTASNAATNAEAARDRIENLTVSSQSVPYTQDAEVVKSLVDNVYNLDFKIPRGQPTSGHDVEANPSGTAAGGDLTKLGIDGVIYNIAGGGGQVDLVPIKICKEYTVNPSKLLDGDGNVIADFSGEMIDHNITVSTQMLRTHYTVVFEVGEIDEVNNQWIIRMSPVEIGKKFKQVYDPNESNPYQFQLTTQPATIYPITNPFDIGAVSCEINTIIDWSSEIQNDKLPIQVNGNDVTFSSGLSVEYCYDNYVNGTLVEGPVKLYITATIDDLHNGDVITINYDWTQHYYSWPNYTIVNTEEQTVVNMSSSASEIIDYPTFN